ncbi:enoyl-CoA hydratase/isomerase family protein [Salinirubellus sp. GCM10025818]|uniref:enoyl-CoA hydratase/isomerase family protein n=1 Tax=Salinirubellus TaxID=2162630 RepID=UPI0030CC5B2C
MSGTTEDEWEFARLESDGHRADVIIDRPEKRNAMDEAVLRDLTAAVEAVSGMEDVRAMVMLGEGPVFSAGMDLGMMRDRPDEGARELFPELLAAIENTSVPTVAAAKRAAPAGAFELTLPFDFRILGTEARYGVLEVKLGTFPHGGATQRLPRLVGLSKAKEIVLTGEFVDPEEALSCGLVHDVVPDARVDARAREFADDLCANAPLGMTRAKRALDAAFETSLEEGLELERELAAEIEDSRDYREGFDARLDGREPEFEGR